MWWKYAVARSKNVVNMTSDWWIINGMWHWTSPLWWSITVRPPIHRFHIRHLLHPSCLRPTGLIWKSHMHNNPNTHLLTLVSGPYLNPGVPCTVFSRHQWKSTLKSFVGDYVLVLSHVPAVCVDTCGLSYVLTVHPSYICPQPPAAVPQRAKYTMWQLCYTFPAWANPAQITLYFLNKIT